MKAPEEIRRELRGFTGTDGWHRFNGLLPGVYLTDGTKYLAEAAGAYWLMDVIGSHLPALPPDETFAIAKLAVTAGTAVFTLADDEPPGTVYARQDIELTDFPLAEILLYVVVSGPAQTVILLPSEY